MHNEIASHRIASHQNRIASHRIASRHKERHTYILINVIDAWIAIAIGIDNDNVDDDDNNANEDSGDNLYDSRVGTTQES